jgi:hypothetical protein
VIMVWQTALPCHAKVLQLDRTVVFEKMSVDFKSSAKG